MQLADDVLLAAANKPGQSREFYIELMFDWEKDGTYDAPDANLSDNFESAKISRQLSGSYPDELEVTEGFVSATMDLVIGGDAPNTVEPGTTTPVSLVRLFSPYAPYAQGGLQAVATPVYLNIYQRVSDGTYRGLRQFTGYILECTPSLSDGTVSISVGDLTSQMNSLVTFYPRAPLDWQYQDGSQDGGVNLNWYLEYCARSCGVYQGPPPPSGAIWYSTGCGGSIPEVGNIAQTPRDGRQGRDTQNDNSTQYMNVEGNLANYDQPKYTSPAEYPYYSWNDGGPFGPYRKRNAYTVAGIANVSNIESTVGNTAPRTGFANGLVIGMSCYYLVDDTPDQNKSVNLGGSYYNYTFDNFFYQNLQVDFPSAKQWELNTLAHVPPYIGFGIKNSTTRPPSGQGSAFSYDPSLAVPRRATIGMYPPDVVVYNAANGYLSSDPLPVGWNYVGVMIEVLSVNIRVTFNINGNVKLAGLIARPQSTGQGEFINETWRNFIGHTGGAQHMATWTAPSVAAFKWSRDTPIPGGIRSDIHTSWGRALWHPDVQNKPAWDTMKDIAAGELGSLYVTENGILKYENRIEMMSHRDAQTSASLTLDDVNNLDPATRSSAIVNTISYTYQWKWAQDGTVWASDKPDQFVLSVGDSKSYQVTAPDAMSVLGGDLVVHRETQGIGISGGYTRSDIASAYGPDYWKGGLSVFPPGDDPLKVTSYLGGYARAELGWATNDFDPRHIRMSLRCGAPAINPIEYSPDGKTAFLKVRGLLITADDQHTNTLQDLNSVAQYGTIAISREQSDWSHDYYTQYDLTSMLLQDVSVPKPIFKSVTLLGDIRRQLQDVHEITDRDHIGGPIRVSIVGVDRTVSVASGVTDELTMRTLTAGGAWIMDDDSLSIMDSTTIVG